MSKMSSVMVKLSQKRYLQMFVFVLIVNILRNRFYKVVAVPWSLIMNFGPKRRWLTNDFFIYFFSLLKIIYMGILRMLNASKDRVKFEFKTFMLEKSWE